MRVLKRNDRGAELVSFDKITHRIQSLTSDLSHDLDITKIAQTTISSMYDMIPTTELDKLSAKISESFKLEHLDYSKLAARIYISNMHKSTPEKFSECMWQAYDECEALDKYFINYILENADRLDAAIDNTRDNLFDYFGLRAMENQYLIKNKNKNMLIDRPQYLFMRVAIGLTLSMLKHTFMSADRIWDQIIENYTIFSNHYYTHASPTLFNACGRKQQYLSCFVKDTKVYTVNAGVKNIQDVIIGDEVISHTGKIQQVVQTHVNELGDRALYRMKINKTPDIIVTGNHRLFAQPGVWVPVDKLRAGQYVATAGRSHISRPHPSLEGFVMDYEFFKYLGYWFTHGQIITYVNSRHETTSFGILFILPESITSDEYIFLNQQSKKIFGFEPHAYGEKIAIYSPDQAIKWNQLFGQKRLPAFMHTSIDCLHLEAFLSGYTGGANINVDLYHLCRSYGMECSLKDFDANYEPCFTNWMLINDVELIDPKTDRDQYMRNQSVYTLGVEHDHSYNVEGIVAENCFLLGTDDSIEGIMKTISNSAYISKWAGGIGVHMSNIRAAGSAIAGTQGHSNGIVPQIKIYNEVARTFDQGGRRKGAIAVYLEPWHADILEFLRLKLNTGDETERARDLFYALWMPDLFIKRLREDGDWSLFSNDTAPGLADVYDGQIIDGAPVDAFTALYTQYEMAGLARKKIKARDLANMIFDAQRESGTPYICWKDHVNRKSNQNNIGTIKSSNLCAEIMEVSGGDSYACCTLASINLPKFLTPDGFDFEHLHKVVKVMVKNLDQITTFNDYPVEECRNNNLRYRPIGIGIQGLANVFCELKLPFCSAAAEELDLNIAETIYHAALTSSVELSYKYGAYEGFENSPAAKGLLQFDLWGERPSDRYDWNLLKEQIREQGLRNSLLIALMPTVGTSQIFGNNESFEPFQQNIYTKTTLFGKYQFTNNSMVKHLSELGLWTPELAQKIISNGGSVLGIAEIPAHIQNIYKTVWELPQRDLMLRAAKRGRFIDQSQSLNIYLKDNSNKYLRSIFLYGHEIGLKTGSYYIKTQPRVDTMKNNIAEAESCPRDCISCSA